MFVFVCKRHASRTVKRLNDYSQRNSVFVSIFYEKMKNRAQLNEITTRYHQTTETRVSATNRSVQSNGKNACTKTYVSCCFVEETNVVNFTSEIDGVFFSSCSWS